MSLGTLLEGKYHVYRLDVKSRNTCEVRKIIPMMLVPKELQCITGSKCIVSTRVSDGCVVDDEAPHSKKQCV